MAGWWCRGVPAWQEEVEDVLEHRDSWGQLCYGACCGARGQWRPVCIKGPGGKMDRGTGVVISKARLSKYL
jgi:hypothetical protein